MTMTGFRPLAAAAVMVWPLLGGAGPGKAQEFQAQDFDVSTVTCSDVTGEDEAVWLMLWLDGYLAGQAGDTRFSTEWLEDMVSQVEETCTASPNRTVMSIILDLR